jgi:pimeloyl-ACP methyl ester carboxylesterase
MPYFRHEGFRLAYTVHGSGPQPVVLLPGLLFSQRMHLPLARELAKRGHRVITMDPLGHGRSDRPPEMWRYGMPIFAQEVIALLDHLELDQAVVGGTSLGANTTLEVASAAPERLRGMLLEMPVLDNALLACAIFFTPMMVALTFGEPVMRLAARVAKSVPSSLLPFWGDVTLDVVRQDPAPSAGVLHGLFFGRTAPHRAERASFEMPALVIGHHRDPIHPFSDAGMLTDELPDGRLVEADSLIELRVAPERLTDEIAGFLDDCWRPRRASRAPGRRGASRRAS